MTKRIVVGSYEVPGWGGSATTSYALFEKMQRDGLDVAYVNLISEADGAFFTHLFGAHYANPRMLENVHSQIVDGPPWKAESGLADLLTSLEADVLVASGIPAAWLMRRAGPKTPLVFLTTGSLQIRLLLAAGRIRDFLEFQNHVERGSTFRVPRGDIEREVVEGSDLIVVHSPLVRYAFEQFFPAHMGKVYENLVSVADLVYLESRAFADFARPFADRDIDVILVASNWNRREKNYGLATQVISGCPGLDVHVVGEIPGPVPGARCHGILPNREALFALLGRSKSIVCPSLFDAAPTVLFEASAMGCNVIASPNCGNWQLCHEQLLADTCTRSAFVQRIERSLTGAFPDNREHFLGGYADLVDTLDAFSS